MEHLTSLFSVKLQLYILMLWCQVKEKRKKKEKTSCLTRLPYLFQNK